MQKHRIFCCSIIVFALLLGTSCRDPRVFYPGAGHNPLHVAASAHRSQAVDREPVLLAEDQGVQLLVYSLDYAKSQLRAKLHNTGPRAVDRIWLRFADPNAPAPLSFYDDDARLFRLLPNQHSKRLDAGADFAFASHLPGRRISPRSVVSLRVVALPASDTVHHIIARADWDPQPLHPRGVTRYPKLSGQYLRWIVIHHTATWSALGPAFVREIHVDWRGWADIGYHYIIGEDGSIYAGRDLHLMGAHAGQSVEANQGVWRARHARSKANRPRHELSERPVATSEDAGFAQCTEEAALSETRPEAQHEAPHEAQPMTQADRRRLVDLARHKDPDYGSIGISLDGDFRFGVEPTAAQEQALVWLVKKLQMRFHISDAHIITHREVAQRLVEDRGLHFTGHYTECPGSELQAFVEKIRQQSAGKQGQQLAIKKRKSKPVETFSPLY